MDPFARLPQELRDHVVSFTEHSDLSSLSKTCKSIRPTALKPLYKTITMVWQKGTKSEYLPLDSLLRSIIENPRLADYVVSLELRAVADYRFGIIDPPSLASPPCIRDVDLFIEALSNLGLQVTDAWKSSLGSVQVDAMVALLVLLCPNLEYVKLGLDMVFLNKLLPLALRHVTRAQQRWMSGSSPPFTCVGNEMRNRMPLRKLKHLEQDTGNALSASGAVGHYSQFLESDHLDAQSYAAFLCLPSLETATLHVLGEPTEDMTWTTPSNSSSSLKDLRLIKALASPITVGKMLHGRPKLTRLEYDFWFGHVDFLDCRHLSSALDFVKDTLSHFRLKCNVAFSHTSRPDNHSLFYNLSLRSFASLKTLAISPMVLLGPSSDAAPPLSSVLPPNLTHVCFSKDFSTLMDDWCDDWMFLEVLSDFLHQGDWRNATPQLRRIDFHDVDIWLEDFMEVLYKQVCQGNGLECPKLLKPADELDAA